MENRRVKEQAIRTLNSMKRSKTKRNFFLHLQKAFSDDRRVQAVNIYSEKVRPFCAVTNVQLVGVHELTHKSSYHRRELDYFVNNRLSKRCFEDYGLSNGLDGRQVGYTTKFTKLVISHDAYLALKKMKRWSSTTRKKESFKMKKERTSRKKQLKR